MLGAEKWEALLGTQLDGYWACRADRTPFENRQFDCVFAYAAFHHCAIGGRSEAVLSECLRLLKDGGRLVLLSEPCAPAWAYAWSRRKLNRIRHEAGFAIEEDVLVPSRLARWARRHAVSCEVKFDTSWSWREMRFPGVVRNVAVRSLPGLGWLVPIGAHLTFTKAPAQSRL